MGDLEHRSIPHDIINSEILPRLPPKSLIRFKCVSKQWNSLISSPQFAKLHLQFRQIHSSNSKQCLFISNDNFLTFNWSSCENYSHSDPKQGLIQLELGNELSQLIQASFAYAEGIFIVGSCHGLICLDFGFQLRLSDYIFIWNPSIRELRKIPNPSVRDAKKFTKILNPPKFRKQEFICGFGYVSSGDEYKIVNVTEEKGSGRKRGYVFGLKVGSWRKIRIFDGYSIDSSNYSGLLIDEILFWRMNKGVKTLCIIGFDLVDEKFDEVQVPEWIASVENFSLSSLGRCLCVFWNDNVKGTMEVSMLKEYGNWESWLKVFCFGCQYLCRYQYFGLTEAGNFLVHIDGEYIRLVDLNQNPPSSKKMLRIGMGEDIVDYVETVISPFSSA